MECQSIVAVHLKNRTGDAPDVQEVFTDYGGIIQVRVGIHADHPTEEGLILLHVRGEEDEARRLVDSLNDMEDVRAQMMRLES